MRLVALACSLLLASCVQGGPWPARPSRYRGDVARPIAGQDPDMLAKVTGAPKESAKYPPKTYWIAAPDWRPIRSLAGVVIGRRTANPVIAKVVRYDGAPEKWPDLCVYEEITVKQDALDQQASLYAPAMVDTFVNRGEVDCKVYDAAPAPPR